MNSKSQPRSHRSSNVIKARGAINSGVIKTKKLISDVTHQPNHQGEGHIQGVKGYTERKQGTVKEQLQKVSYAVSDGFKKFGMKLQQQGYDRAGRIFERVGHNLGGYGA